MVECKINAGIWSEAVHNGDIYDVLQCMIDNHTDKAKVVMENETKIIDFDELYKELDESEIVEMLTQGGGKLKLYQSANDCEEGWDRFWNETDEEELVLEMLENGAYVVDLEIYTIKGYCEKYDEYGEQTLCEYEIYIDELLENVDLKEVIKKLIKGE